MAEEISEYDKQANDFLAKYEIEYEAKFNRYGSMQWDNDGAQRDIYDCVFRRGRHNLSIEFGQSLVCTGKWILKYRREAEPFQTRDAAIKHALKYPGVTQMEARSLVSENKQFKVPTAYDVLACIVKSDPGTFDDFCSEFGYSNDSISAKEVWQGCREQWNDVRSFFSRIEIEEMQEIQ